MHSEPIKLKYAVTDKKFYFNNQLLRGWGMIIRGLLWLNESTYEIRKWF